MSSGVGLGLINPSTFIAVNSYFTSRRGQAIGLAMAGTGLGQMIMPHVVRLLLDSYGFKGTILIMGGLALNGVCEIELILAQFQTNQLDIITDCRCIILSTGEPAFAVREGQVR